MTNDYAHATGAPRTISLDGVDYKVPRLRPRDLGAMQQFVKERVPNPKVEARRLMEGLPDAVAIHIWDQAVEEARDWPPPLGSPQATAILMSAEGQAMFLHLLLSRTTADFTEEKARELAERISVGDMERLIDLSRPGEPGDPKAAGAGTTVAT